jgi:hypothetical protein
MKVLGKYRHNFDISNMQSHFLNWHSVIL